LSEPISSAIQRERSTFDELAAPFEKSLVLFGAGGLGRKTLAGLRQVGIEPLAFADNNPALWGHSVEGLPVFSPPEAAQRFGDQAAFVVTIWRAGGGHLLAHTRQQLQKLNCARVISFASLFWKHAEVFLPYYAIGLPHELLLQAEPIRNAAALWADTASRREYLAQVRWRLRLDFDGLPGPVTHPQYFPDDLFALKPEDVFVDCGAFDGDSLRVVFDRQPAIRGPIFAIEPDPGNLEKLRSYVRQLPETWRNEVHVLPWAVGARRETLRFSATATAAAGFDPKGTLEVQCVPLDEILTQACPTFIKMDIEGAELEALQGARQSIMHGLPILAICVYHQPDHLWRIPRFIHSLSDQYRFFLRPHNEEGWDLVCYAIPVNRLTATLAELPR